MVLIWEPNSRGAVSEGWPSRGIRGRVLGTGAADALYKAETTRPCSRGGMSGEIWKASSTLLAPKHVPRYGRDRPPRRIAFTSLSRKQAIS